jgi:spore maturation protein CgeB
MKILFVSLEYDSYDERRGKSFEYNNFYLQLVSLPGCSVSYLPFDYIKEIGVSAFRHKFIEKIKEVNPDLVFAFMYTDELDSATLEKARQYAPTIGWFSDDHWRLENYSRFYAPHFTKAITTWSKAKDEYARYEITNIIRSQWACNVAIYHPMEKEKDIDVSFAGMRTERRSIIIEELESAGLKVFVTGTGWPTPKLSLEKLVELFSRSKINLNLNPPMSALALKPIAQIFFRRSANRIIPDIKHLPRNIRSFARKKIPQIKARPFEIAGCGGFCISGLADDIDRYYIPDREMVFYQNTPQLIKKIKYYLSHDAEREIIAKAGYERTIKEHTYQLRFRDIFRQVGL